MIEIEQAVQHLLKGGNSLALVTIIAKNGSAPRLPGSKMVVEQDGSIHGTIGGGGIEHFAREVAVAVAQGLASPDVTEFDMQGSGFDGDTDMICGGIQLVLIERITPEMNGQFEKALHCFHHNGAQGVWVIDISDPKNPSRSFVDMHGAQLLPDNEYKDIMRRRVTRRITRDGMSLVIDPLPKCGTVVLVGGGHVSKEVAFLAAYVDFEVLVCDDREEFANKDRFPMAHATHVLPEFKDIFQTVGVGEEFYILVITRGHSSDQEVLAQALRTSARYIGMIGSRRKRDICYRNLRQQGFGDADLARVHCPVGLSIGSETPKEIAVSIIAELVAARAGVL